MLTAFLTGFFLGLSLIIAIGAQNAFILRQGILGQHVFYIALFCSISDALLIVLGIVGISYFFNDFVHEYSKIIFGFAALWLCIYGFSSNWIKGFNSSSNGPCSWSRCGLCPMRLFKSVNYFHQRRHSKVAF